MTVLPNQQLDQAIEENIRSLYISQLGQQPQRIRIRNDDSRLTIFLENGLTSPEQFLLAHSRTGLVQEIRQALHEILQPRIKSLIEQLTGITVVDTVITTNLNLGFVNIIVTLAEPLKELYPIDQSQSSTKSKD
jgi:uncharacterized protein YbcI